LKPVVMLYNENRVSGHRAYGSSRR
jgi:hypothetical protein